MQKFKNILIPTDFSNAAWNAVQLGLELTNAQVVSITLLHVFPSAAKFNSTKPELGAKELHTIERIKGQMDTLCADFTKGRNINLQPIILGGSVEEEIMECLRENEFDLIIMGVNSNGQDNEPGSHTAMIIANCQIPVLVVPNQDVSNGSLVA